MTNVSIEEGKQGLSLPPSWGRNVLIDASQNLYDLSFTYVVGEKVTNIA